MIHWGVLGIGNIAKRFMKGLSYSEDGKLYGAASLTASKREEFAKLHPEVKVYASYEEMLDDPEIDAVYIAVRHADHYKWSKEALLRNKAVLCEKPATLSYAQTKELCELSKQKHTFFMEAMKTRFIPMVDEIKTLIAQGTIGDVLRVETSFCNKVEPREGHYLFEPGQGGILYDVASYNILSTLDYIHSPVVDIKSHHEDYLGVDVYDHIELTFESGQTALIEMALDRKKDKALKIVGTLGTIHATPFYRPQEATVEFNDGESYTGQKPYIHDDFFGEIEEVHRCLAYVEIESPRMSHQDSLDCMDLIERIKESFHD